MLSLFFRNQNDTYTYYLSIFICQIIRHQGISSSIEYTDIDFIYKQNIKVKSLYPSLAANITYVFCARNTLVLLFQELSIDLTIQI